jgi:hypothetical protein
LCPGDHGGFDTHSSVKTSTEAGSSWLATKVDLAQAKADLQRDGAEPRAELQRDIAEVRADLQRALAETKADILKWTFGMIGGTVVINAIRVVAVMLALVRIVGH